MGFLEKIFGDWNEKEIRRIEKQVIGPTGLERTFVFVEKTGKTDEKYPRRAGKVTKKPL